jgi:hypothetical protein
MTSIGLPPATRSLVSTSSAGWVPRAFFRSSRIAAVWSVGFVSPPSHLLTLTTEKPSSEAKSCCVIFKRVRRDRISAAFIQRKYKLCNDLSMN